MGKNIFYIIDYYLEALKTKIGLQRLSQQVSCLLHGIVVEVFQYLFILLLHSSQLSLLPQQDWK